MRVGARSAYSRWMALASWTTDDGEAPSTSVPGQRDDLGWVDTDTFMAAPGTHVDSWQLRVTLVRREDGAAVPALRGAFAMVSAVPRGEAVPCNEAGPGLGLELAVPPLSQRVHSDLYPPWGRGDAWCSPTSMAMVLDFWGARPDPREYAWVAPGHPDRHVVLAVRRCYDHAYGAGNWSFNAAWAASRGLHAYVTRVPDVAAAETFIAAGVPLIASISVHPDRLASADYTSPGHLVVITGFTRDGDVICNDPAARDTASVRRVYRREQFARAWGVSAGIVYVIHPPGAGPF
jgi:peptidase C39-like protein